MIYLKNMNEEKLQNLRHSYAHLLAAAALELWNESKLTIGPSVQNGFYYDIDFPSQIGDGDLEKIESKMKEILRAWKKDGASFTGREVDSGEAKKIFANNPYKLELINEIESKGEKITLYKTGDFEDLCRGGHGEVSDMREDAFKISHAAGAYWRGDEKNKMLTRIYGLAFETKDELKAYIAQQEEAKKRDHRKLGKELGLFVFSELVGPGLPLWTPKGTIIRELLNDYVWELRKAKGYQKVTIPHITKKDLYETSGHWSKFKEELFKIETREKHLYAMKPMNCPHHTQIFASSPKSYRDMPQRYCETTMVYRDEQSGELNGLSRVLSITQDDAHVFCRESQIENEVFAIWDIIDNFYSKFGFELSIRFSRHDPEQFEKYLGTPEIWNKAESSIKDLMEKRGITPIDGKGEAAMYGPKIDFISKDSIGRTLQVATIQLDFNQPKNFDLTCTNEKGEKEQIVMVHCAIMGSIERFMSTLIEHLAGNFPLWLSPVQIAVIPVAEAHNEYANSVYDTLIKNGFRAEFYNDNDSLGKKIKKGKEQKIPYLLVLGNKEIESGTVTVEKRGEGNKGAISLEEFVSQIEKESENKSL